MKNKKDILYERVMGEAKYIVETRCTIREVAVVFNVSKSCSHKDLKKRLKEYDLLLFNDVLQVLRYNSETKHIRGGIATKAKYKPNKVKRKII